jgi:hypothetical protein
LEGANSGLAMDPPIRADSVAHAVLVSEDALNDHDDDQMRLW